MWLDTCDMAHSFSFATVMLVWTCEALMGEGVHKGMLGN